ncbi:GNAT family N-acetyltransferase [Frigoribacterium sp. CFBP 13712]|uniref:GNAT family N-acetyltransferase n=1 Tax=Frigoribacterium sp. CFBP 13712 TaxID=2775309 RepID=UPI00178758B5|nr:GNAT family N-acetyltransferase [Frigoribacterium sp. CFBP 13712]
MTAFDDDYDIRTFPAALAPESTDDEPRADAETARWVRAEALGFHEAAPDENAVGRTARRLAADGRTETGVYPREPRDGSLDAEGQPVATFESFVKSLNVGGGRLLDAHLISGVTVQPTHRRRGLLRRLMTDDLARAKGAGLAVAALTASEGSIYRRFGFGVGVRERTIEVDQRRASGLLGDPEGSTELVSRDALVELAPAVFARYHARTPGSIDRHEGAWNRLLGRERPDGTPDPAVRGAVHRDSSGVVDGYVAYRLEGADGARTLVVLDLVSATDDAYLGLWQLLLSVDLVATVQYAGAQQSDPLGHALVDGRAVRVTHDEDHVWFRVLDTVAALQARPWAADGVVTIAVGDSLGHAAGTFRVTSEGGSATVKRAAVRRADIELDVATLGSLWLGGVDPVTLAAAGLVRERRKGAVQTVRAMIAADRPLHSITHF